MWFCISFYLISFQIPIKNESVDNYMGCRLLWLLPIICLPWRKMFQIALVQDNIFLKTLSVNSFYMGINAFKLLSSFIIRTAQGMKCAYFNFFYLICYLLYFCWRCVLTLSKRMNINNRACFVKILYVRKQCIFLYLRV